MNVFIITEGGEKIGFGHITRCSSLYQGFEEERIKPEFIINSDVTEKDLSGIKRHRIFNWLKEKEKLFKLIKDADIVIIDSYLADLNVYKEISQLAKIPVYIDDNRRLNYPKGIVVNGTIYAGELNYSRDKSSVYLLGSQYIPLRKEFWKAPVKKVKKKIASIMVTFGGYDRKDITREVLEILNDNYKDMRKNVVIGRGCRNISKIKKRGDNRTNFIYDPDAGMMKKIMFNSDIAISAGGQTLYELARTGVPSIGICVANNQKHNLEGWQKSGVTEYVGWYDDKDLLSKLLKGIDRISGYDERIKRSKAGRSLVDGRGVERIIKKIT